MPLLDWRLVCYAFSTPDESKIGERCTKRLLREAVRGIVPEPIRARTDKRGYNTPVREWLDTGLADWVWDEVNDPEFLRSELWDAKALRATTDSKRRLRSRWTHGEAYRVLSAVTAHWWQTRWLRRGRAGATATV